MSPLDELERNIAKPAIEYRPELRWWLAAGGHTDETLKREISIAHQMGFGGMEFLAMPDGDMDLSKYGWGSKAWDHSTEVVAEETTKRNMSVSFTSGTNWSNANLPNINPDHPAAAKEMNFVFEDLKGGESRSGEIPKIDIPAFLKGNSHANDPRVKIEKQELMAVVAAKVLKGEAGSDEIPMVLDVNTVDLTSKVSEGKLDWQAPSDGLWRLFFFYMHGTGQIAIPSSTVNYTVNYMDPDGAEAVIDYWDRIILTPTLRDNIKKNPRAQMYMDSLELFVAGQGGIFWGQTMYAEFEKRRGYSIRSYLPFMTRKLEIMMSASQVFRYQPPTETDLLLVEKVRFDLVRTCTDLYIENMLLPFQKFLHGVGIKLRAEISYGLPFELTRPGIAVDGIETESLEFGSQIDAYRLMSGVAHLFGKQYSSETGANSRNLMLPHSFYDQIIYTQYAAGISKMVLHGWSSMTGVEGTKWPGHEGMWPLFSERFDTRQPGSEMYPLWCDAMGRIQYILRQGKPRMDVGILRSDHATDNLCGLDLVDQKTGYRFSDEKAYGQMWMRNRQNHWWEDLGMQDAGWNYEFFDGTLLLNKDVSFDGKVVQPDGPAYQALIIYQSGLDPDVAKQLLAWAKRGLKLLFVDDTREVAFLLKRRYFKYAKAASSTQGNDGRDDELAQTVKQLLELPNVKRISKQSDTVSTLRQMGVRGRTEFTSSNQNFLTYHRQDGNVSHLFIYNFLYEMGKTSTCEVTFEGEGAAFRVDPWVPTVSPWLDTEVSDGQTKVRVTLQPGECTIITLDRSQPAAETRKPKRDVVAEPKAWTLQVESWDAGEVEKVSQDSGFGFVTTEDRPTTAVTKINAGKVDLKSWKDISAVGKDVSGIGEYRSILSVPEVLPGAKYTLDLGSTCGGLGSVSINGSRPRGFDTSSVTVDVSDLIKKGDNELVVRVSTSLNNRLMARGYYDHRETEEASMVYGNWAPGDPDKFHTRDYGLTGPVKLYRETWA